MKKIGYKSSRIFTPHGVIEGYLIVNNDKIVDVLPCVDDDTEVVDYESYMIMPGIIDIHNHGFAGWSMTDAIEDNDVISYKKALCSVGVTTVLPTAKIEAFSSISNIMRYEDYNGAIIHGIHSEGPFWARGGENTVGETWPAPNLDLTQKYIDAANGCMKYMALAPELDGADKVAELLHKNGIKVAACHTKAKANDIEKAYKKGVFDSVTHLCNGMQGIHHRDVGALGKFLLLENIYYELIADLNHVCSDMIRLIMKIIDHQKVMLISDSNYMANMPIGLYERYGKKMVIDDKGLIKDIHGRICGSGKYVLFDMKQLVDNCGLNLEEVSQMASYNPACFLGIDQYTGSLRYGNYADFMVVNDNLECRATFVHGNKCFDANDKIGLINPEAYERRLG